MNPYIENEMIEIEKERHCSNKKLLKYNRVRQMGWIMLALAALGAIAIAECMEMPCPYCDQPIQLGCSRRETWICPKPTCGYENYVGIEYCGLCGTKRAR